MNKGTEFFKKIKWKLKSFGYLKVYNSPFIRPKLKFHLGKIQYGTPYFYPRRWVKDKTKPGYQTTVPKKIGFDFVSLGWKTKWKHDDYRFEWSPMISFVFFKLQICLLFKVPCTDNYWECWLYYHYESKHIKSVKDRIAYCRKKFPCKWTVSKGSNTPKETICYWDLILKKKHKGKLKINKDE